MIVVRRLIIGLRHHINCGAPKARSSVHITTNMQVKRLRLPAWRAPCPEPWDQPRTIRAGSRYPRVDVMIKSLPGVHYALIHASRSRPIQDPTAAFPSCLGIVGWDAQS